MTANQINWFNAQKNAEHYERSDLENKRHNLQTETQSQYINTETAAHYARQDAINASHYQRADQASLINAEAAVTNAATKRKEYEMAYDIEYNYPISFYDLDPTSTGGKILLEKIVGNQGTESGIPFSVWKNTVDFYNTVYSTIDKAREGELTEQEIQTQGTQRLLNLAKSLKEGASGFNIVKNLVGILFEGD